MGLGRVSDAIGSWERVRSAVPDFEPVYMDLADTYAATGDLTAALAIVREAAQRWPESPDVHSAIGVIHVRRGAIDDGIESLVRAAELAPDDALTHLNLGRAYALRYHRGRRYDRARGAGSLPKRTATRRSTPCAAAPASAGRTRSRQRTRSRYRSGAHVIPDPSSLIPDQGLGIRD